VVEPLPNERPESAGARSQDAESGILAWIDRDITGPMHDFRDPDQEWRRLFSELYGTFLLVIVAAGGGMMGAAFPETISRTAAVVAPGLMVHHGGADVENPPSVTRSPPCSSS
jgi:hypothetical protein